MSNITIELGTAVLSLESMAGFEQVYQDLSATNTERMADGTLDTATAWSGKIRTQISATGWVPPALSGVDFTAHHTLKCGSPRVVHGANNTITIPAARRSDSGHTPLGFAIVDDQEVATTISGIVTNVATLDAVSGASGYLVRYWPELIVKASAPRESNNTAANTCAWSLIAEQV